MVTLQVTFESLGWPPSVGYWLHAGKNSRVSHSKVKEGLFREQKTLPSQSMGYLRRPERQE